MKRKLGKLPVRKDARTFKLSRYLTALPPLPTAIDWSGKVPVWGELGNDYYGDCVLAAAGHLEMTWTANSGVEFVPADADILAAYSAITGFNADDPSTDNGTDMLTALNFWRNTGIAGRKILCYTQLDSGNLNEIKAAIAFFGGADIGAQIPQSAIDEIDSGSPWSDTSDTNIVGGHAISIIAYDQKSLTCVTWGQLQKMSWDWFQKYCDEAYCTLSLDWLSNNGLAPSGFNLTTLQSDLAQL